MAVQFVSGSPSVAVIAIAATADTNKPNVYLNTTETTAGATEMTVTAWSSTSCTFDDPVGAPTGSLKLGLENTRNGAIGWIDVTVSSATTQTASGTPLIAAITRSGLVNVFKGTEGSPSVGTITTTAAAGLAPTANGMPELAEVTVSATVVLRHSASATAAAAAITTTGTVTAAAAKRANGVLTLSAVTTTGTVDAADPPAFVPVRPESWVLQQDSTAGDALIRMQQSNSEYVLAQRTYSEDEIPTVAPTPTKAYYLQQEPDTCIFELEDGSGYLLLEKSAAVADQIEIQIPKTVVTEESSFTATAYFRDRDTKTSAVPTTVQYRVDCLTTKTELQGWTSVATPASSNAITITSTMNAIQQNSSPRERKQLIVRTDSGLSSQLTERITWVVNNIYGISIN